MAETAGSELEAYVSSETYLSRADFSAWRERVGQSNEQQLKNLLMAKPMNLDSSEAERLIQTSTALSKIEDRHEDYFDKAVEILARRYERRCDDIRDQYAKRIERQNDRAVLLGRRDRELEQVKDAYRTLFTAIIEADGTSLDQSSAVDLLIAVDPQSSGEARDTDIQSVSRDKEEILKTITLAKGLSTARAESGRGIFITFVQFKLNRFHRIIGALLRLNVGEVVSNIRELVNGACWLVRFHLIYSIILVLICLAVWSIVGGAICRISALQFSRDERIGPLSALKFSMGNQLGQIHEFLLGAADSSGDYHFHQLVDIFGQLVGCHSCSRRNRRGCDISAGAGRRFCYSSGDDRVGWRLQSDVSYDSGGRLGQF